MFSREGFVWEGLDPARRVIIAPSIDVFSPKNAELGADAAESILAAAHLRTAADVRPVFRRLDGSAGEVTPSRAR